MWGEQQSFQRNGRGWLSAAAVLAVAVLGASGASAADRRAARDEVVALRTATTKVFREADGKLTAEIHAAPIHFREGGSWAEIDPVLTASTRPGFALRNRAGPFALDFAAAAKDEEMVSLASGQASLRFGLVGASPLSLPLVAGERVTYASVLPDVDLALRSVRSGLKELLVLKRRPAGPVSFTFSLALAAVTARQQPGGEILLVAPGGRTVFEIPPAWMSDAAEREGFSDKVPFALESVGGKTTLTLRPDLAWLRAAERVYPVTIDPSVSLFPTLDTYVRQDSSVRQDTATNVRVGNHTGADVGRTLVKFDVSSLAGQRIVSADLKLFQYWAPSCTGTAANVLRVTSDWDGSVVWSTQPTTDPTPLSSVTAAFGNNQGSCPGAWLSWPVKTAVESWLSGAWANYGLEVVAANETDTNFHKRFDSFEATNDPYLRVTYNQVPGLPTNLLPVDGTVAASTTPTLSGTYNDPDGADTGFLQFEVYRSSNNTLVASGNGNTVSPGQTSSWTVPAGSLTSGVAYYWRARSSDTIETSAWTANVRYTPDLPPATPALRSPADGKKVETRTPVLDAPASDPDGNKLSYLFQLARDTGFTDLVGTSEWLPTTHTFTIPADWRLRNGTSYYWRAQAKDEHGLLSAWSVGRRLETDVKLYGVRDYWPMWSYGPLAVNEITGNLTLSLPTPSFPSAVEPLIVQLSYNSRKSENSDGLGAGWTLAGSPAELNDWDDAAAADQQQALELEWEDGSASFYTEVGDTGIYKEEEGDFSELDENDDGTWTLLDEDGSLYMFGAADPATDEAEVVSAEWVDADVGKGKLDYAYNGSKLTSMTDSAGRRLTLIWNSLDSAGCPGALLCIRGPDNVTWRYVGSGAGGTSGKIARVNNGTRDLVALEYSGHEVIKLQNANDLNPAAASPGYNGAHALTIAYDASQRVSSVTDGPITGQTPSSSTWTFGYNPGSVQTSQTQAAHGSLPAGSVRTALGYTTVTPPRQQGQQTPKQVRVYYDELDHPIETVDLLGNGTRTGYTAKDQLLWTEDEEGAPTDYEYDSATDVLVSVTGPDPDGGGPLARPITRYRYDEQAIGTSASPGPALQGLQASYYKNRNLTGRPEKRQTDANVDFNWGSGGPPALPGTSDNFSVSWKGNLSVPTEGDYTFSTVADDGIRLVIDNKQALNNWTDGGVRTTESHHGIHLTAGIHKLTLEYYDATGTSEIHLRWACPNCSPAIVDQVLPSSSLNPGWLNQTSTVSPLGRVAFSHYADQAGGKTDYELVKLAEGTNIITSYVYDTYGRVIQKVMPKGNAARTIDPGGNLQGSPDLTYATSWSYYGPSETAAPPAACGGGGSVHQGELFKSKTPNGIATATNVYDNAGRPISETNSKGSVCHSYNAEGRTTSEKAPGDVQSTNYTYDPAGAPRTATDASGTVTTEYDEAGRVKRSLDSFGAEAAFGYDAEGNMTQRNAAAGPLASNPNYLTAYTYDDEGKLGSLTDPATRIYTFFYDRRGNLKASQYPNGTFSWQDYNAAGWLTGIYNRHGTLSTPLPASVPGDASPVLDLTYSYELEGRKTQEIRTGGGLATESTSYAYDNLGRLEQVTLPSGVIRRYSFDLDSNRVQTTEAGTTVAAYTYDPAQTAGIDQLTSATEGGQTRLFVYSADGETAQRGADTLTWNGWGRHTGGSFSGASISYSFDPLGFRRQRVSDTATSRYLHGGLFETDGSGSLRLTDVDGPESDLAHYAGAPTTGTPLTYRYYNGHGDLAAEADGSGIRITAFTYDPFGSPREAVPNNVAVERWTGRWDKKLDTASSLVEMGARPYDPALGRFLTVDPVEGGSLNGYDFSGQDPVNAYDLDGRVRDCGGQGGCAGNWGVQTIASPGRPAAIPRGPSRPARRGAGRGRDFNTTVNAIVAAARSGAGNFSIGSASARAAIAAGRRFVGSGFRVSRDGSAWISKDGRRIFSSEI